MDNPIPKPIKSPMTHLQIVNLIIAIAAGIMSLVGGIYTLKANFFTPKTGIIEGVVNDGSISKPLWLVPVEISTPDGAVIATVNTDETGHYAFTPLMEGNYIVKINAPMHKPETKSVKIIRNLDSSVNFSVAPIEEKTREPEPVPSVAVTPTAAPIVMAPQGYNPQQQQGYAQNTAPVNGYTQNPTDQYQQRPHWRRHNYQQQPADTTSTQTTDTTTTQPTSSSGGLQQVVGQLLQDWAAKKTSGQ